MYEALRKGATVDELFELTKIKHYFIEQMKELVEEEEALLANKGQVPAPEALTTGEDRTASLTNIWDRSWKFRKKTSVMRESHMGVEEAWEGVHVSGTKDSAYYYSTYQCRRRKSGQR